MWLSSLRPTAPIITVSRALGTIMFYTPSSLLAKPRECRSLHSKNASPDISFATSAVQMCAVQFFVEGQPLVLAAAYCSSSTKVTSVDFGILFQKFKGKWIVGGDFNAKNQLWGSRWTTTRGRELATVLTRRQYGAPSNGQPTYWPIDHRKTPDVIDFFVVHQVHGHQCHIATVADVSSDHLPVCLTLSLHQPRKPPQLPLTNRLTDWSHYRSLIDTASQHHHPIKTASNLDDSVTQVTRTLQTAARTSTLPLPTSLAHSISPAFTNICHERHRAWKILAASTIACSTTRIPPLWH